MAYVPPTPLFTSGNAMAAAELDGNNSALRTYINIGIVSGDIGAGGVTTTDIVRGEFVGVTPDHQFTTGDLYTQFEDYIQINEKFWTSHIKPYNLISTTGPYFPIAGSGKRIVLEKSADILYSVGALSVGNANYQLTPGRKSNGVFISHTIGDVIHASDILENTLGRTFTEDPTGRPGFVITDDDGSGNIEDTYTTASAVGPAYSTASSGIYCRRWYSKRMPFLNMPAGVHHFFLVVNARCDKGHFKTVTSQIEVFNRS